MIHKSWIFCLWKSPPILRSNPQKVVRLWTTFSMNFVLVCHLKMVSATSPWNSMETNINDEHQIHTCEKKSERSCFEFHQHRNRMIVSFKFFFTSLSIAGEMSLSWYIEVWACTRLSFESDKWTFVLFFV